jgi:glycosyltransferase involved in cell wall biosynthesis
MRVLVANHTLDMWGGSECYAFAVAEELVRRGHGVELFTARPGCVSDELERRGIKTTRDPRGPYDLQLISHRTCVERLRGVPGIKVQTCHGTIPGVEQPVRGVDHYVAVSEEVQTYLKWLHFDSTVIHNGIDCERFRPKRPIRMRPERVLALAHTPEAEQFVAETCRLAGLRLVVRCKFKDNVFRIEDDMNEADIVVTLGRGAYEAMACARNVYVYDKRRYQDGLADGMATADNIDEMLRFNCSGRRFCRVLTPQVMADELLYGYRAERGQFLRAYAVQHLNICAQVDSYLALRRALS